MSTIPLQLTRSQAVDGYEFRELTTITPTEWDEGIRSILQAESDKNGQRYPTSD